MCCSFLGQIIFGAVMVATLALTLASMFTPGWRDLKQASTTAVNSGHLIPESTGLFSFLCKMPGQNSSTGSTDSTAAADYCKDWWKNLPSSEKAVVVTICLAAIFEVIAVIWTLVSICACCCKNFIIHPLPALATIIAICLAVAVGLYGSKYKESIGIPDSFKKINESSELGYSFYLACGALAGALVDIIVGTCSIALAKRCL